jgi:predicted phage gp36 major capsid-like protein
MTRISSASDELARLRERAREVEASLRAADADEARLLEEIAKVDAQAGYYDSLAGEMKRDLQPPTLSGLIRSLRW